MLADRLEDIGAAQLAQACADKWRESHTLDFKRSLPARSDDGRREFLKDVCAFANADGGDLVYGVAEVDACADEIIPIAGDSADAVARRLGQILDAGLEPRLIGIRMWPVDVEGGYVLIVRVPASWAGPHRFAVDSGSRFVIREGTRTADLSYEELRMAFNRSDTLIARARDFRADRVMRVNSGGSPMPLLPGPLAVMHLIPISAMAGRFTPDVASLGRQHHTRLYQNDWGGAAFRLNLDGFLIYPPGGREVREISAYTLWFRSGAFEALRIVGRELDGRPIIPSTTLGGFYRDMLTNCLRVSVDAGVTGPGIVGFSLLRVTRHELGLGFQRRYSSWKSPVVDRSDLVTQDTWVERLEAVENVDLIARPMLDVIWQCFDVERCQEYDAAGNWNP